MKAYRGFLERLFCTNIQRQRRFFLQQWHRAYPLDPKKHKRPADAFREFMHDILYERTKLILKHDRLCFFGNGSDHLSVRLAWIKDDPKMNVFLIDQLFAKRNEIFEKVRFFPNNAFTFEGFLYDQEKGLFHHVYRREIIRDFAFLISSSKIGYLGELIAAVQGLLLEYHSDPFLRALHWGLQGQTKLSEVLCWGNTRDDLHPNEEEKRL